MTLKTDMIRALEDEDDDNKLKDVTLVGSDGGRVSASKAVLAIRSGVFQRMFFGNFQERDSDKVSMDYPVVVLQVIVKYCYIDELDLDLIYADDDDANTTNNNNDNSEAKEKEIVDRLTDDEAVLLVQVRDAANYLELFELHKTISNELGESILSSNNSDPYNMKKDLACVCAIMQELMARGGSDGPLFLTCLNLVTSQPEACLLPAGSTAHNRGILACSIPLMEKLLQSSTVNPFVVVKSLQKWNQEHKDTDDIQGTETLKSIAEKIDLKKVSATQLADIKPCELFPMERLYEAFVFHGQNTGRGKYPLSIAPFKVATPTPFGVAANSPFPSYTSVATIRGAGVECANGIYAFQRSMEYERKGLYGDIFSTFCLMKRDEIWKVVVFPNHSRSQELVLYESAPQASTGTSNKPNVPPFALWKCVDGKDPTPYVSMQGGGFSTSTGTNLLPPASATTEAQLADAYRAQLSVANSNNGDNNNNNNRSRVRRRGTNRSP